MNVIIAVTFLGILMHAFAEECELMPPAENLVLEKYFGITHVYVTHSKNGTKESVCREYETTKNGDDTTNTVVTSNYNKGGVSQHTELKCTNRPKAGSKGQFDVECEVKGSDGSKIKLQTSVIATDNEKYALLQTCSETGQDDILVLQTNKVDVEQGVKSVFDTLNWKLEEWYSRTKVNCDDVK